MAQKEVRRHVFESRLCQCRRDFRSPPVILRIRQCRVEVPRHQQCGAPGPLLERGEDTIYRRGVVRGEVTSNDVPPPRSCRQLEADDVGSKLQPIYLKFCAIPRQ